MSSVESLLTPLNGVYGTKEWANLWIKRLNGTLVADIIALSTPPTQVIYKPGAIPSPLSNIRVTWDAVVAEIIRANGAINVIIDDSIVSPAPISASVDCFGLTVFSPYQQNISAPVQIIINSGIQLINPKGFLGPLIINCNSIGVSSIVMANNMILLNRFNIMYKLTATSTNPALLLDNQNMVFSLNLGGGSLDNSLVPLIPVISLINNSSMILLVMQDTSNSSLNNTISGGLTETLLLIFDSSFSGDALTQTSFTGTILRLPISKASSVSYDDSLVLPSLGDDRVQSAIDTIKSTYATPADLSSKVDKAGDTMTGDLTVPHIITDNGNLGTLAVQIGLNPGPSPFGFFRQADNLALGINGIIHSFWVNGGTYQPGNLGSDLGTSVARWATIYGNNLNVDNNVSSDTLNVASNPFLYNNNTNSQTITTNTNVTVEFPDTITSIGSGISYAAGIFTCAQAGLYTMSYDISWVSDPTGQRSVRVIISSLAGAFCLSQISPCTVGGAETWQNGTTTQFLTAGTTINVLAYQDTGGNLDIPNCKFSIAKIY